MSVKVRFNGICTHTQLSGTNVRRIVLVRADHGERVKDALVPPHIPTLRIKPTDILHVERFPYGLEPSGYGAWRLCGVELSLSGGSGSVDTDDRYGDIPPLRTPKSPPISGNIVAGGQAACYFDVTSGVLSSEIHAVHGAVWGVLTDETNTQPVLHVKAFWNDATSEIHLKPGAEIMIEHVGMQQDSDEDFLLHYRILEYVPDDAKPPAGKTVRMKKVGDISIGCSNSQYP